MILKIIQQINQMFDKIQMIPDDENEHFKQPHIAIEKRPV